MTFKKSSSQVNILGILLDVVYHYDNTGYVQLESVTDDKGEQDLMPIINQDFFDEIIEQIKKIEQI